MDFSEALKLLKRGDCLHRKGWNGKGMYVFLASCSPNSIPQAGIDMSGTDMRFFCMHNAQGNLVVWAPSQEDLLAEDWCC